MSSRPKSFSICADALRTGPANKTVDSEIDFLDFFSRLVKNMAYFKSEASKS